MRAAGLTARSGSHAAHLYNEPCAAPACSPPPSAARLAPYSCSPRSLAHAALPQQPGLTRTAVPWITHCHSRLSRHAQATPAALPCTAAPSPSPWAAPQAGSSPAGVPGARVRPRLRLHPALAAPDYSERAAARSRTDVPSFFVRGAQKVGRDTRVYKAHPAARIGVVNLKPDALRAQGGPDPLISCLHVLAPAARRDHRPLAEPSRTTRLVSNALGAGPALPCRTATPPWLHIIRQHEECRSGP